MRQKQKRVLIVISENEGAEFVKVHYLNTHIKTYIFSYFSILVDFLGCQQPNTFPYLL